MSTLVMDECKYISMSTSCKDLYDIIVTLYSNNNIF